MADLKPIKVGDYVQDTLGHYMQVAEVLSPYRFKVRILFYGGPGILYDSGNAPVVIGRSEIRGGHSA